MLVVVASKQWSGCVIVVGVAKETVNMGSIGKDE